MLSIGLCVWKMMVIGDDSCHEFYVNYMFISY